MFKRKYDVEIRPSGYQAWKDQTPIRKPNVKALAVIFGLIFISCSLCSFIAGVVIVNQTQPEDVIDITLIPTLTNQPTATPTETATATSTEITTLTSPSHLRQNISGTEKTDTFTPSPIPPRPTDEPPTATPIVIIQTVIVTQPPERVIQTAPPRIITQPARTIIITQPAQQVRIIETRQVQVEVIITQPAQIITATASPSATATSTTTATPSALAEVTAEAEATEETTP